MRRIFLWSALPALLLCLGAAGLIHADGPREAPDLAIPIGGDQTLHLRDFRGKVVALEFIFTTCIHCQHASELMTKLQEEYGRHGFQALAVAFNPMAVILIPDFVKEHHVGYPVGFAPEEAVHGFLQVPGNYRLLVPQLVLIDKKGLIRQQTPPAGEASHLEEKNLRAMIERLLGEPVAPQKTSQSKKKTS